MAAMKARTTSEETAAAKQKRKDNAAAKRQRDGEVQSALRTWLEAQPANSMKKGAIVSWAKDGGYGEVYQENWLRKRNGQRGNDAIHDAWQRASKYTLPSSSAPASSSSSSTKSGPSMSSRPLRLFTALLRRRPASPLQRLRLPVLFTGRVWMMYPPLKKGALTPLSLRLLQRARFLPVLVAYQEVWWMDLRSRLDAFRDCPLGASCGPRDGRGSPGGSSRC